MPSVREMLQNQLRQKQKETRRLAPKQIDFQSSTPSRLASHLLSPERRKNHKHFIRDIYVGWFDPCLLPQTNADGSYSYDDHETIPYEDPELLYLNNYHCIKQEIQTVLNFVCENLNDLAELTKAQNPITNDSSDCIIEVNFNSNPSEWYIHAQLRIPKIDERQLLSNDGVITVKDFYFAHGTWQYKENRLKFFDYSKV